MQTTYLCQVHPGKLDISPGNMAAGPLGNEALPDRSDKNPPIKEHACKKSWMWRAYAVSLATMLGIDHIS